MYHVCHLFVYTKKERAAIGLQLRMSSNSIYRLEYCTIWVSVFGWHGWFKCVTRLSASDSNKSIGLFICYSTLKELCSNQLRQLLGLENCKHLCSRQGLVTRWIEQFSCSPRGSIIPRNLNILPQISVRKPVSAGQGGIPNSRAGTLAHLALI